MGTKPRQSVQLQKKNARIVSFDDAKRTSARKAADDAVTQAVTKPLSSQSGPTSRKPAARKAAKPSKQTAAGSAKAAPARKRSRKEISIARGAERDGALSMRSEEEIEAEARAQEESRKQDKRNKSRVRAFSKKMRDDLDKKKRARNKAKAEKKFDAAYGGSNSSGAQSQSSQSEGAPRAAVYEGKMGASHKKSAKLQAKAAGSAIKNAASGVSVPKVDFSRLPRGLVRALAGVAVVALVSVAMYGPAQDYYQQMRETDRLQAEYAAVAARSSTLQSTIDSLRSDEGIEDKAHTDLGYVKKGEQTATVKGANIVDNTEFSSNVAPGSVPAPDTWYSPVLDVLFGYSG